MQKFTIEFIGLDDDLLKIIFKIRHEDINEDIFKTMFSGMLDFANIALTWYEAYLETEQEDYFDEDMNGFIVIYIYCRFPSEKEKDKFVETMYSSFF